MASAYWQVSMLACALLLSAPTDPQPSAPEAEPSTTQEEMTEMTDRPINVDLRPDGNVRVVKEEEHQLHVNGGDRVIWRFPAGVNAADFHVELRGPDIFTTAGLTKSANEISGTVDGSKLKPGVSVGYDIFKRLDWEDGPGGGGCIKPGGPPNPG